MTARFLFATLALLAGPAVAQDTAPAPAGDRTTTRDAFLARSDERFARMDANGDGQLSGDELAPRRQGGEDGPAAPRRSPMARADANGDGIVTRDEYRAATARRFDRLDANHDGVLDAVETGAWRQRMERRAPPPANGNGGE